MAWAGLGLCWSPWTSFLRPGAAFDTIALTIGGTLPPGHESPPVANVILCGPRSGAGSPAVTDVVDDGTPAIFLGDEFEGDLVFTNSWLDFT